MEFIKTLISKVKPAIKKSVGIFVSANSTIEVVEYDHELQEIKHYGKADFSYDLSQREVNVESFESALQIALRRFDIPPQTHINITLPNIFINSKSLPSELGNDEIMTALISETEKNYIFKKLEPAISWNLISSDKDKNLNTYVYSALQQNLVERIEEIFKGNGLKLSAIESSYSSFIRGLSASGLFDEYISKNLSWCTLIIKNNLNTVITLKGEQIVNIIETPMALSSLEAEDIYPALSSSFIEKLQDIHLDSLVIANYSKVIDINQLVTYFTFKCPFVKIENNHYKGSPLFTLDLDMEQSSISPEAIGAAYLKITPVKFSFNFISTQGQDELPDFLVNLGITGNPVHLVLLSLIAISFAVIALITLISLPVNDSLDKQYVKTFLECNKYKEKFDKPQSKVFNIFNVVKTGFENNEKIVTSFDAISSVIPKKLWVTSIGTDSSANVLIVGKAYSVDDIISYYKNLLSVSKFNNLKIQSIKVVGDNDEPESASGVTVVTAPNQAGQPAEIPPPSGTASPAMLPPPPSASGLDIAGSSVPKYYEFTFGNVSLNQGAKDAASESGESKSIFSNLTNIAKDLKFNKPQ